MKAIRHAVGEMHQRDGAGLDIGRIEHGEVAAVLPRAIDHREQQQMRESCRGMMMADDVSLIRLWATG